MGMRLVPELCFLHFSIKSSKIKILKGKSGLYFDPSLQKDHRNNLTERQEELNSFLLQSFQIQILGNHGSRSAKNTPHKDKFSLKRNGQEGALWSGFKATPIPSHICNSTIYQKVVQDGYQKCRFWGWRELSS